MGILDYSAPDPFSSGLLGLASGLLTPVSRGGGFGAGLLGMQQGMDNARHQALQLEQMRQSGALHAAQMETLKAQAEQRALQAKKEAEAQEARRLFAEQFKPGFDFKSQTATAPGWNPQMALSALNAGYTPEQIKLMAESNNLGRAKVARTVEVQGSDGKPMTVQLDEFGAPVGQQMPKAYERKTVDIGGSVIDRDPYTGQQIGSGIAKTMTPGEIANNQIAQGQLRVAQGNLGVAQANLGLRRQEVERGKWQYDSTRGGLVNLQSGEFRPAMGQSGPLQPTMDAGQKKELLALDAQDKTIDAALEEVKRNPEAFGRMRGLATIAGSIPETIAGAQQTPAQQKARSFVYNVVSKVINERAGAAQSAQELARLRGFLPGEMDTAEQIINKFEAFKAYLAEQRNVYAGAVGQPRQSGAGTGTVSGPVTGFRVLGKE